MQLSTARLRVATLRDGSLAEPEGHPRDNSFNFWFALRWCFIKGLRY